MRRRRDRPGCCLPLLLGTAALAVGLCLGVLLPEPVRVWMTLHLPARLGGHAPTPMPTPAPTPLPTPVPTPTPIPTPPPAPLPTQLVIPPHSREVARLYNGWQVRSTLDATPGRQASYERETAADYALDLQVQIKVPVAARTLPELAHSAPTLAAALPKLPALLAAAEVSRFYYGVYQLKTDLLRQNLTRLDALMPRDVFYDTDTILEMQDPDTKRKALLIQSDMDVDTDGSDPDRQLEIDASDPDFQPLTSYKWPRRTAAVSPLLAGYRDRLTRAEADLKAATTPGARRNVQSTVDLLRNDLYQLEHYSSLIARNDPYIVLPGFMARQNGHPYQPKLGDYAVVLAGNTLYPAIFGDIGPSYQMGEASLRLAQAVDPRANAQRSPVNDLKITYLVFPGTADPQPAPPDLGRMRQRCQELLNEIGGNQLALHEWVSVLSTPTPSPTLVPAASPTVAPATGPAMGQAGSPAPLPTSGAPRPVQAAPGAATPATVARPAATLPSPMPPAPGTSASPFPPARPLGAAAPPPRSTAPALPTAAMSPTQSTPTPLSSPAATGTGAHP